MIVAKSKRPLQPRAKFTSAAQLKIKAKSDAGADSGSLSGYLAVYDVIDSDAEIFIKGCFAKSIEQKVAAGKVPLMSRHFRDGGDAAECVGTILKAHEDGNGLFIDEAPFASDSDAQKIRTRIVEGHIKGLSVGFIPRVITVRPPANDEEKAACAAVGKNEVVEYRECELLEGTTTVRPANELAEITASKSEKVSCPHCGKDSAAARDTAKDAPPGHPGTAPKATAATTTNGKAARDRRLKLLGVR